MTITLAGCQSGGERQDPVALGDGASCDQCGMVIDQHPGPAGQTYYQDNTPVGHDAPARFCGTTCTYRHQFENEDWTPETTYLTDYPAVDYDVQTDGGTAILSRHLDPEAYTASEELTVVANTDVESAMGTVIVPFSEPSDAESFAETYGDTTLAAESIGRELVA